MESAVVTNSPLSNVELHFVDSLEEAENMARWLGERHGNSPIGLDTESGGLFPYRSRCRLIQLGDMVHGWAVPVHWFGAAYQLINSYTGDFVLHNSSYDWQVLKEQCGVDIPFHRMHDSMAAAHLMDPERPKGLKPLADRLVDPRASSSQYLLHDGMAKQGWTWDTVPYSFDPYWIYSALDPVLTCHIWSKIGKAATLYPEPYDIERSAIRFTAQMSRRGVLLDMDYVDSKIAELQEYQEKAHKWLAKTYGIDSVGSSRQIANALKGLDIDIRFFTATGQPQMDKDALLFYMNQEPDSEELIRTVRGCRKAEKMVSTYFQNFKGLVADDGRLHCAIHPCAAKTSRMSITDPALQTLPTDDKLVRGAIIADPGSTLISCDFNQVEMREAAHFSGDENLIETFRKADAPGGKAFFLQVAEDIFGEEISKLDKRYGLTKNVGYGYLFGAGLEKMAKTAGVTQDQMAPVREAFLSRYPGLEVMSRKIIQEGRDNASEDGHPYVLTPTGRKLTVDPGKEYVLVNRMIQGHAAEILKIAGTQLEAADLMDMCLLPIHDEFLLQAPIEDAEQVKRDVETHMGFPTQYKVPLNADAEILGPRWVKQ